MRSQKIGTILGLLVGAFALNAFPSYAVTNFTANVFGVAKSPDASCPATGICTIRLSGAAGEPDNSYNGFTIAGIGSNPAQIVADDATADSLRLENATITGPAGVTPCSNSNSGSPPPITNCPTIYFSALFNGPPKNDEVAVAFTRSIGGALMRNASAATNSAVRVEAWVQGNAVGSAGFKKVTCISPTPNCGTLNHPQISDTTQLWPKRTGLTDPREHLVQLWFYSKFANDTLKINFANLQSAAGSDIQPGKPSCVVNARIPKERCKQD